MDNKEILLYSLGKRIKFLRKEKGFTQLSFSFEIDCSKNFISDIETGRRNPSVKSLKRIADGLGVTLEELFKGL